MEKKTRPAGAAMAAGTLVSLGVYLGLVLITAALMVRGAVGEEAALPVVVLWAMAASFCGALVWVRRCPWGRMACGLAGAAAFAAVVSCVAMAAWRAGAGWLQSGWLILTAIMAGGVLAGTVGRKRGKRVKRPARRRL